MVYAGISIDGSTELHIIRNGALTGRRYRDENLTHIVIPYIAAIGEDFILIDDNCRPSSANFVNDFLLEKGIIRMEWPPCSPDINPIEHGHWLFTFGTFQEDVLWDVYHPHKLSKDWKELFCRNWTEYHSPLPIASLIPCLKGVQCCWLSRETIHPIKNDFLLKKSLFYFLTHAHELCIFPFVDNCSIKCIF